MDPVLDLRFSYIDGDEQTRGKPKTPMKGTPGAAGYDLFAAKDSIVPAKGKALISTGLMFEIPPGTYGRVGMIRLTKLQDQAWPPRTSLMLERESSTRTTEANSRSFYSTLAMQTSK